MKTYSIIMTPDAKADLWELRNYIAEVLQAPLTAKEYIGSIRNEISKLEYLASSIAPVPDEPWRSRKIRRISAKEFFIYYRIDETNDEVHVLNIIYQRRDQLRYMKDQYKS